MTYTPHYIGKHREGNQWKRRWCILTESHLTYYAMKNDIKPKGVIILTGAKVYTHIMNTNAMNKKGKEVTTLEILTPQVDEPKKSNLFFFGQNKAKNPRMFFQADTEIESKYMLYVIM